MKHNINIRTLLFNQHITNDGNNFKTLDVNGSSSTSTINNIHVRCN